MKRYIFPIAMLLCISCMQPTFAMNSEFQKPDDIVDDEAYATPAEEDTGETIVEQATDEVPSPDTQNTTPPPVVEAPTERVTSPATQTETVTTEPAQTRTETKEQTTTAPSEQQIHTAEEPTQTEAQEITPITSPSDGNSADVVIEQTSNFWLLAIAGGAILIVIVAILFQRLRKNNPYDR